MVFSIYRQIVVSQLYKYEYFDWFSNSYKSSVNKEVGIKQKRDDKVKQLCLTMVLRVIPLVIHLSHRGVLFIYYSGIPDCAHEYDRMKIAQ